MASSKEYLEFILGQLSELEEITYRAMMGEFIIYYRGKIVGGIYDDRLLVKPVKSAIRYMPTAPYELPYEGAKEMLLVDEVDNKEFLTGLFHAMYDELPAPKTEKEEINNSQFDKEVLCMKKRISRILGLIMLIIAIAFIVFALNHPEMSFPWNNTITWLLYCLYILVTVMLLIAPKTKK